MPYSGFQSFSPTLTASSFNLHRLKTAFSPASSRPGSTSTMSPFSPPRLSSELSPSDASLFSSSSEASSSSRFSVARLRQIIMLRHRPSTLELGLEQERREFGQRAVDMFEPRPAALGCCEGSLLQQHDAPIVASIFEVLDGSA